MKVTHSRLMRLFITWTFSFYFAIAIFVSLIHVFFEYRNLSSHILEDLKSVYGSTRESLSIGIWEWNHQQVNSLAKGIYGLNFVSGVVITANQDELTIAKGSLNESHAIRFSAPIIFSNGQNADMNLGTITLVANQSVVWQRIKVNIVFILANAVIKSLFLALIILIVGRRLIGFPVGQLYTSIFNLRFDSVEKIYSGKVPISHKTSNDDTELTDLMRAYNNTLDKVIIRTTQRDSARLELENRNLQLERLVEEKTLSLQAKVAELNQANEKLNLAANTDFLTGALNRRAFLKRVSLELTRLNREKSSSCILMVDLDFFKKINDKYGHATGDKVLISVVNILSDGIREHDLLARFGGEEFVVFLGDTPLNQATEIAERLRQTIEQHNIELDPNSITTTASIGITQIPNGCQDIQPYIDKADLLLYRAKEKGRNRVESE